MGSSQIYTQKMFADMQTALGSVRADMTALSGKIDSQILKMDSQIAALGQINTSVGQSIQYGKTKYGVQNSLVLITADNVNVNGIMTEFARVNVYANGSIKIVGRAKRDTANTSARGIFYSKDGGTTKTLLVLAGVSGAWGNYSDVNLPVSANTQIIFYNETLGSATVTIEAGMRISYDLIDVTVQGYITLA